MQVLWRVGDTGREGEEQSVSFVLITDSLSTARTFIQQVEIRIFFLFGEGGGD